jgi:predicted nuclease of predicted toxin-antitoxin system
VIRFHLDENVDHAIAHGLRLRGVDVTTTSDAGLIGADDPQHIAYARAEGRVIFTQDQDFLRRHAAGDAHLGIVYSQQGGRSIGEIVRFLHLLSDCLDPQDMRGQLEFF